MLAMIAGLHSPRRKPQVNAMDQVSGTYRPGWAGGAGANSGWPRMVTSPKLLLWCLPGSSADAVLAPEPHHDRSGGRLLGEFSSLAAAVSCGGLPAAGSA
jgi:hypothetical protein